MKTRKRKQAVLCNRSPATGPDLGKITIGKSQRHDVITWDLIAGFGSPPERAYTNPIT
jgi:hypothetical protein